MSDFDEEAERERLREQYERDQKKREATEKMSDLLLKGATMTNAHCENCGDPIFRYDGREFCPTCQRVVEDEADTDTGGDADVQAGEETTEDGDTPASIEVKSPSGPPATTADAVEESPSGEDATDSPDEEGGSADTPPSAQAGGDATTGGVGDPDAAGASGSRTSSPADRPPSTTESDASLSAARESLVRTLVARARQAEACEDPRQARAHLEAAREAAETLAALSS